MATEKILSPYGGRFVGEIPFAGVLDVANAIVRAQQAYQVMRKLPRFVRADLIQRIADLIKERCEQFVQAIDSEAVKPLYDARGEVARSIVNLQSRHA